MGSVVPIIYCKREGEYGGLRVNTNLLWSQVLSVGGGQFFKGLFLVGEAGVEIDYEQIALGNNTLASYELIEDAEAGRVTLYYDNEGGRISFADYKRGVLQIMTLERKLAASLTFIASSIALPFAKRSSPATKSSSASTGTSATTLGTKLAKSSRMSRSGSKVLVLMATAIHIMNGKTVMKN